MIASANGDPLDPSGELFQQDDIEMITYMPNPCQDE